MVTTTSASATQACAEDAGSTLEAELAFQRIRISLAVPGGVGENLNSLDRPDRADGGNLHARLLAGANDAESARMRVGQEFGRNPTRRACAHLPEQIGLDHRLKGAIERRIEQRVILRPLHPGIGFEPVHALGAVGRAHQVEGTARQRRALARQIGGRRLTPRREQRFKRRHCVLDRDKTSDVRFGEIDRRHDSWLPTQAWR